MKFAVLPLPLLVIGLSACSKVPEEPKTIEEVVEESSELVEPLPGQYTSTTTLVDFQIPGQPPAVAQQIRGIMGGQFEQSTSSCLSPEEAARGFEEKFRQYGEGDNGLACDFNEFDVDGSEIDAVLSCKGPRGLVAGLDMDGRVGKDSQTINMDMKMSSPDIPGGEMVMKMKVVSKRTGDCV